MRLAISILMSIMITALIQCGKSDKPQTDAKKSDPKIESRYVTAKGGLRMREKPDTNASVLETIPEGEKVEFIEETGNDMTISGATGKWSKIKWRDKTGWGFGGFLSSNVKSEGSAELPEKLLKTYRATGPVEPGNLPARIILGKKMIAKYYGGSNSSHSYCLIENVEFKGNRYHVRCSERKPNDNEMKQYIIEGSAENMKNIIITMDDGNVNVNGSLYVQGNGL